MSAALKETITDFLKNTPLSEGARKFLIRLRDDPDRCIDRIWRGLLDTGQPDSIEERAAFVRCFRTVWKCSESAILLALISDGERLLERFATQFEKNVASIITSEKVRRTDKVAAAKAAAKVLAELDPLHASRAKKDLPMLDIRSDLDGSRQRTAFIRAAASFFHWTTREWHDNWTADLANIAFPGHEITIDMVRSARRGVRSWVWPTQED